MQSGIPVYSFVGFSGTGKTTLIEKLIVEFKHRGLRIAAVKHDAHHFELDREGKDSWRMTNAGADVTVLSSATHAAIIENRPIHIEVLLSRITDVDLILTEGYKHGDLPKLGVFRAAAGKPLPEIESAYLAIISDVPLETDVPCLPLDDVSGLADFILADMRERQA